MKFLVTYHYKPQDSEEVWGRFKNMPQPDFEIVYPATHIVGTNEGFAVIELEDINVWHKYATKFRDLVVYKTQPILDAREALV